MQPVEVCELRASAVAGLFTPGHVVLVSVEDDLVARVPAYELIRAGGNEVLNQLAGRVLLGGLLGHDVGLCTANVAKGRHEKRRGLRQHDLEGLVVNYFSTSPDLVEDRAEGLVLLPETLDGGKHVLRKDLGAIVPHQVVAEGERISAAVHLPVVGHIRVDKALRVPLCEGFPEVPGYAPADGRAGCHGIEVAHASLWYPDERTAEPVFGEDVGVGVGCHHRARGGPLRRHDRLSGFRSARRRYRGRGGSRCRRLHGSRGLRGLPCHGRGSRSGSRGSLWG